MSDLLSLLRRVSEAGIEFAIVGVAAASGTRCGR